MLVEMVRDNVKFVGNGVTVYIATTAIKENFTNGVKVFSIPTKKATPNISSLINLNKVERRFTVDGYLCNGKLGTETYTTAEDKKNALTTMFGLGSVVVMTWEGTSNYVAIDKYEISYKSKDDKDSAVDGEAIYNTKITCIVGSDII